MLRVLISSLLLICLSPSFSQTEGKKADNYPEVGKPMPNFILSDVQNFPSKQVKLKDFKGKWLILDWWTKHCLSCIEGFPKIDALQKVFKNQIQIIQVAYTGSLLINGTLEQGDKAVRSIYGKVKKTLRLTVPFAFDSILYKKFNLGTTPYIVIIDPDGIVQGITYNITEENISDFLAGKKPHLRKAYRKDETTLKQSYNAALPYLTYDNGGADTSFLFRSLLSRFDPNVVRALSPVDIRPSSKNKQGRFEVLGKNIESLYRYAYFGKDRIGWDDTLYAQVYPTAVLDGIDASVLRSRSPMGDGKYCYSLIVPPIKCSRTYLMEVMQADLKKYFGYDALVEERKMPYWKLIATNEARMNLQTRGRTEWIDKRQTGLSFKNYPLKIVISFLSALENEPPFVDETGIEGNVDISFDAYLTDFNDFKKGLNSIGLDLVKGEKEMKVLVVRK